MKRKTRLIVLCCVLVLAVGAAVGVSLYEEQRENIAESGEVVFELPVDDVSALSWEYTDDEEETVSLAFTNDGGWTYDGDAAFPVDGEAVNALLEQFSSLQAAFVIEDVEDYGQYGLDEPLCTIDIAAGDTEYGISLGNYSELDYQRYVSLGDGKVYLVNDDPMEAYKVTLDDLMLDDEMPSFVDVTRVEFAGAENYAIERDEEGPSYRADDVYYADGKPLDPDSVDSYVAYIASLALGDYYTYDAAEEDIAECGLDEPELTVTIDYPNPDSEDEAAEALSFTLSVSRSATDKLTDWDEVLAAMEAGDEDAAAETEEPTDEDAVAYLRVGESAIIYEIDYDSFKALMACAYDDLRYTELFPGETADLESLSVELDGETYEFTTTAPADEDGESGEASGDDGEEAQWYFGGEEVSLSDVSTALGGLAVTEFADGGDGGEVEISLTAELALDGGTQVDITIYRVDGESCFAEVDGEGIGYVPRSQVVDLIEAVNAIALG